MNTLKTLVVSGLMLAVGYGTHVVLNQPAGSDPLSASKIWEENNIELPGIPNGIVELPPLTPSTENPGHNPFSPPAGNSVANPFVPNPPTMPSIPAPGLAPEMVPVPPLSDSVGTVGRPNLQIPPNSALPVTPVTLPNPGGPSLEGHSNIATRTPSIAPAIPGGSKTSFESGVPTTNPSTDALFARTWQETQIRITEGKLADALATLSSIYNAPLNNEQRGRMIELIDQLAGSVIYSKQHRLHPAYTPRIGETIGQIAARQRVTADFLARVNETDPNLPLNGNTPVKLVTGPFRAELSPSRREITVFLGPRYAGRFAVSLGRDFPQQVAQFEVFEKSGHRVYVDPVSGQQIPAGDPNNPYGAHWIGLRPTTQASGNFGMHSVSANIDAADSRGCIGLSHNDAEDLKAILELGSTLTIVR